MPDFKIDTHGHTIEIDTSSWNGSEAVSYDGVEVSKKRSFMYLTAHSFTVLVDRLRSQCHHGDGQPRLYRSPQRDNRGSRALTLCVKRV